MHKALKRPWDYSKKKQRVYRERDEKKRERFINLVKPKKRLVFVDESIFDELLYREYARSPRRKKVMAEVSGKKFERQNVVTAKINKEIIAPFRIFRNL